MQSLHKLRSTARALVAAVWVALASAMACTCQPAPPIPDASAWDAGARDARNDASTDACPGCLDAARDAGTLDRPRRDVLGVDHAGTDATADDGSWDSGAGDVLPGDVERGDGGIEDAVQDAGPLSPPETPTALQVSAGALVRLTFAPSARASTYQALVSETAGGPYRLAGTPTAAAEIWLEGLALNLTHHIVVRAHNAAGDSALSSEVEATPRDGVAAWRGQISGLVSSAGQPVEGAEVRLYDRIDHGVVLAQAFTAADGCYVLHAPSGLFRGLVAGLDELPQDGNAFEIGYDSVGWVLADAGGHPAWFEVKPAELLDGVDVALAFTLLERQITGAVQVDPGWPLGRVVVQAIPEGSPLRPHRLALDAAGAYTLAVSPGVYTLQAFLDVDGDGERGLNEPRAQDHPAVDVTAGDSSNQDLSIPGADTLQGILHGADGWSVAAYEEGAGEPAIFTRAAPDGVPFELVVPAGRQFSVLAFVDQDGNGRRSLLDVDGDGQVSAPEETWSEPGLAPLRGVAAGSIGLDLTVDLSRHLRGQITPAMQRWTVVARDPSGDRSFASRAAPDGSFDLTVSPHDVYLLLAYVDEDGDGRRTPAHEPLILHGSVVDASAGDVDAIAIVQRQLVGTFVGSRADLGQGRPEVAVAQQLVQGYGGGLLCASPVELASSIRAEAGAAFTLRVGALGTGAGSLSFSSCAPLCTGVTLIRYLDQGGDYSHHAEGCVAAQPLVYPASLADLSPEALVLDTSAGDLMGLSF
ncbi:MAG: hypothetical protein ABIJ09_18540 [Pseudomonadota bacterium]